MSLYYASSIAFKENVKEAMQIQYLSPPSSATSSAASGPPLDETFCALIIASTSITLGATQVQLQVLPLVQPQMHLYVHLYGNL